MEIYVVKYKNRKEKAIHQFQNTDYGVWGMKCCKGEASNRIGTIVHSTPSYPKETKRREGSCT